MHTHTHTHTHTHAFMVLSDISGKPGNVMAVQEHPKDHGKVYYQESS